MVQLRMGSTTHRALLDTGSIYLMASFADSACDARAYPSGSQEYHYAGPSAQFRWVCAQPILDTLRLGDVPVGSVTKEASQKALGLPAVIGLGALPAWASQRFHMDSLLNHLGVHEFWFFLKDATPRFHLGPLKDQPTPRIPILPSISLPTPGLGYLTAAIQKLHIAFASGGGYVIERAPANPTLAQSFVFSYRLLGSQKAVPLGNLTEWFCLFDTGTFPAVFYANATTNLLGNRVTQSILPGQSQASDFTPASVIYTFGHHTVTATHVLVPKLMPAALQTVPMLMTVCGFSMHQGYNVCYRSEKTSGLPESVAFC